MEGSRPSLIKPGLDTPFHIDFDWWQQNNRDWRVHLYSQLCPEHQERFANWKDDRMIDWVDPETAEVKPVDGIQYALQTHCALQPDFLTEHTAVMEAIFRIFLSNGNTPLSVRELSARLNRPGETILRTLTVSGINSGLRPCIR